MTTRSKFGLHVKSEGEWRKTALRFDPDTFETANSYGKKGVDDGLIEDFVVVLNTRKVNLPEVEQGEFPF